MESKKQVSTFFAVVILSVVGLILKFVFWSFFAGMTIGITMMIMLTSNVSNAIMSAITVLLYLVAITSFWFSLRFAMKLVKKSYQFPNSLKVVSLATIFLVVASLPSQILYFSGANSNLFELSTMTGILGRILFIVAFFFVSKKIFNDKVDVPVDDPK